MTFQTFLLIVTILYVCQVGIFLIGLKRNRDKIQSATNLSVSVIIAARDEEANLSDCLESVANQNYPVSLYEIMMVQLMVLKRYAVILLNDIRILNQFVSKMTRSFEVRQMRWLKVLQLL